MSDNDDLFAFRPIPYFSAPAEVREPAPEPPPEPANTPEPAPQPADDGLLHDTVHKDVGNSRPARASRRPPVVRSLAHLTPSFRLEIGGLLTDLHAEGHAPRVWETLRTPARGAWLEANGRSKNGAASMHVYGVAVDIICAEHSWRCPGTCGFFPALGAAAKARGLTWGGDWGWDSPHVQAVAVADQQAIRDSSDIETTLRELGQ